VIYGFTPRPGIVVVGRKVSVSTPVGRRVHSDTQLRGAWDRIKRSNTTRFSKLG
jgi:hypothetical protein